MKHQKVSFYFWRVLIWLTEYVLILEAQPQNQQTTNNNNSNNRWGRRRERPHERAHDRNRSEQNNSNYDQNYRSDEDLAIAFIHALQKKH